MTSVDYSPFVVSSPCWELLVEGFNELTQDGLAPSKLMLKGRQEALYIRSSDGDIVAALAFEVNGHPRSINVALVYVEPSSRRLGYFTALWEELTIRARNADCYQIRAAIHPKDATSIAVFNRKDNAEAQAIWFACAVSK